MARRGTERGRQPPDGVVVGPALAVHDLQRINMRKNMFQPANGGGLTGPLLPADERLRRGAVADGVLRRADDAEPVAVVR